jgi:hypothetical protein
MAWIKKITLKTLRYLLGEGLGEKLARFFGRKVVAQLQGEVTDDLLELLLGAMKVYAWLSHGYRDNLAGWRGSLAFRTARGGVGSTALIHDDEIDVEDTAREDATVTVTFTDPAALRRFLFSKHQDILDAVLKNEVQVSGNYNHVYRFGYLARDLEHRLLRDAA